MAVDFEIPADAQAVRARMRDWVREACFPAEQRLLEGASFDEVLQDLRSKAKERGLWAPFIPKDHGGMGLGPLANALVQMELSYSTLGALSTNSQGPDDASILTILNKGTEGQKAHFLQPLLRGEKRICFAMTERAAGADATGMQTRAEKQPNGKYLLNGEKWYISGAAGAGIAMIMAKTNPDAPRHKQFSTFLVDLPNPGFIITRNIATMEVQTALSQMTYVGHAEVAIKDLEVSPDDILGGEGAGFEMGQFRLAYGRLRHGMHNIGIAQRALDLATAQVAERSTFGKKLSERQAVEFMLADCASQLYIARLMVMHIAYKAERGLDIRRENGIAKVFLANMVHKVVDTALQLHGALGYSLDTPLARWYTQVRMQRIVDGPDEVHKWTTGKGVIKTFREHGSTALAAGGDLF